MKKIFILLLISLLVNNCFSQIQVKNSVPRTTIGVIKNGGSLMAELYYNTVDGDTLYTFLYNNAKYQHITDFQSLIFGGEDNTLEQFYKIMKSVFLDENKKNKDYKVEFTLGKTEVIVSTYRVLGVTSAMFWTSNGYIFLTEKQVDKIFGKDK